MADSPIDSARDVARRVANRVVAKLPRHTPVYTDKKGAFLWLEIDTFVQKNLRLDGMGIRKALGKNGDTPQKKIVGRGVGKLHIGSSSAILIHTEEGFRIDAKRGTDSCAHTLKKRERVYAGKLMKGKVLRLVINTGEKYSMRLLLTEIQFPYAKKALAAIWKTESERAVLVEGSMEKSEEQVVKTLVTMETEEEQVVTTVEEKKVEKEKVEEKKESADNGFGVGSYLLLAGGLSLVGVGVAVRMGYVRVPTGVSTWMADKQEWVLNKWEQVQTAPSMPVKV